MGNKATPGVCLQNPPQFAQRLQQRPLRGLVLATQASVCLLQPEPHEAPPELLVPGPPAAMGSKWQHALDFPALRLDFREARKWTPFSWRHECQSPAMGVAEFAAYCLSMWGNNIKPTPLCVLWPAEPSRGPQHHCPAKVLECEMENC
ncbi:uncharacterized protein PS065_009823 isoform 1-T2 [Dugong dugon]